MKTRVTGFGQGLKKLAIVLAAAVIAVGCGKDNKTGQGDNNLPGQGGAPVGSWGLPSGVQGDANYILNTLASENPCQEGGSRVTKQLLLNERANAGAFYVGISSFGDIGYIANQNGQAALTMFICPRAGQAPAQVQPSYEIIDTNPSDYCEMSEITKATVYANFQGVPMEINLRAAHFTGSSLCGGSGYYY